MYRLFSIISAFMLISSVHAQTRNNQLKKQTRMSNKTILQNANAAVAKGDYESFLAYCTEDTKWVFVGDQTLNGKDKVREYMSEVYLEPPVFNIETITEEGDFVTVTGEISLKNKTGNYDHYTYCDNWRFKNGKMEELKAFVIKKKSISNDHPSLNQTVATPLEDAIYKNDLATVKALLEIGLDVDLPNSKGLTPLMLASGFGHTELVELLISKGANVLTIDPNMGATALHKAAQSGNTFIIQLLLEKGAFIDLQSPIIGNSALMDAILYKQQDAVKILLENGARIELRNNFHESALDIAKYIGIPSMINMIKKHNHTLKKAIQSQPLIKAIKGNDVNTVRNLIDCGINVNERIPKLGNYDDYYTPLGIAARDGHVEIVLLLLNAGADVQLLSGLMGATAAHEAAYAGHPKVIDALTQKKERKLKKGLDINMQGLYNGMTALHDAVWQNNLEAVKCLVNVGADLNLTSHSGLTPLDLAHLYHYEEIISLLKQAEKK